MARFNIIIEDTDEGGVDIFSVIEPPDSKDTPAIDIGMTIAGRILDILKDMDKPQ